MYRIFTAFIVSFFLLLQPALAEKKQEAATATPEGEQPKLYLKLDPALVVNVEDGEVVRFLQVDAQLQFSDALAQPLIEKHMPAIRHNLVMSLSGHPVTEIKTPQGKEKLREISLKQIQKVMTDATGEQVIDALYFTGFVIQ